MAQGAAVGWRGSGRGLRASSCGKSLSCFRLNLLLLWSGVLPSYLSFVSFASSSCVSLYAAASLWFLTVLLSCLSSGVVVLYASVFSCSTVQLLLLLLLLSYPSPLYSLHGRDNTLASDDRSSRAFCAVECFLSPRTLLLCHHVLSF